MPLFGSCQRCMRPSIARLALISGTFGTHLSSFDKWSHYLSHRKKGCSRKVGKLVKGKAEKENNKTKWTDTKVKTFRFFLKAYSGLEEGMDRLSSLPDHIICHILSFLPSKHVVASSILSTRWKYLWASVPVLDFDATLRQEVCPFNDKDAILNSDISFQRFVSRVILLTDISAITKFRLIYQCYDLSAPIRQWFHVALSRNIQELELDLSLSVRYELVKFPVKFFTSSSLVVLKLSRMHLNVPSAVCFSRLKILELRGIMYLNDNCIQNLVSGCQVLEELAIEEIARDKAKVIRISMHKLKRFSFAHRFVINSKVDCPYKFVINAPNLKYFHVKGCISDVFILGSLATLEVAQLDLRRIAVSAENYSTCHQHIYNFLNEMANVKFLTLSTEIVQLLCVARDQNLPNFCNLKELAFGIGFHLGWTRLLMELIRCSPLLEVLTLNNKLGSARDLDDLIKTPPQALPADLLSHLLGILIHELYANFIPESVQDLMLDATVLKRLEINCRCPTVLRSQFGLS